MIVSKYASHLNTKQTPQGQPIFGKEMVENRSGGFVFAVDDWTRLERFLILGSEGGTYEVGEKELTLENAECVKRCLVSDAARAVKTIIDVSVAGRAPKNAPAVFSLAMAAMVAIGQVHQQDALNKVCRTGSDLLDFVATVKNLRGMGSSLRRLIGNWYLSKSADQLAYQLSKYQNRHEWTQRDVLRQVHPATQDAGKQAVFRWATTGVTEMGTRVVNRKLQGCKSTGYPEITALPTLIAACEQAKITTDAQKVCALVREHGLVREHIPSRWLNNPEVWEALLEKMPLGAMVRTLGKMTAIGLIKPFAAAARQVADKLADAEYIRKSRLHPMAILLATKVYGQGHGDKGKLTWSPVATVSDALDAAFYKAFVNVVPTGKRRLLAVDVSGSMDSSKVAGTSLSCREAAAALTMVVARTEPHYHIVAFSAPKESRKHMTHNGVGWQWGGMHGGGDPMLEDFDVSGCSRIKDVMEQASKIPMGGTDCSLPMRVAHSRRWEVDAFEILTDSETWANPHIHPCQALVQYRQRSGINAKLVVHAMTATKFTIADPFDAGMLDVVGMDAATPVVVSDFIRGPVGDLKSQQVDQGDLI